MASCPSCFGKVSDDADYCEHCGAKLYDNREQLSENESDDGAEKDLFDIAFHKAKNAKTRKNIRIIGGLIDLIRNIMGGLLAVYGLSQAATNQDFMMDFCLSIFFLSTMALWYRILWKGRTNAVIELIVPFVILCMIVLILIVVDPI